MLSAFLYHDTLFAEMVEPLLSHVWSQAEVDAHDACGDVAILLKILLDFLQHFFFGVFCRLVGITRADKVDVALYFLHQLFLWTEVDASDAYFLARNLLVWIFLRHL